jgi:hypothetical protein
LLRGVTDIGQMQNSADLAQMDRDFRERQLASQQAQETARMSQDKKPAAVVEFEYYQGLDDAGKAAYDARNPAYNPNAETNRQRMIDDANRAFDNALKALPESGFVAPGEEAAVAQERQRQAALLAYPKWVALMGEKEAAAMARQYGLSDKDLLLAPTTEAVLDERDPLGLGL